jgi:hypothetical protein
LNSRLYVLLFLFMVIPLTGIIPHLSIMLVDSPLSWGKTKMVSYCSAGCHLVIAQDGILPVPSSPRHLSLCPTPFRSGLPGPSAFARCAHSPGQSGGCCG